VTHVLVVDNYDSFVHTIVGYLERLGARCTVVRNDDVSPGRLRGYDGVLVSPGPGTPQDAGASMDVVRACADAALPMLGVCLGHQALAAVYGADVVRAPELLHGRTSQVTHDDTGVLAGLPSPFTATRYHSLTVDPGTLPAELVPTAWTETGLVMGLRHTRLPLHGVQFHPESVLTQGGHQLFGTWLQMCGARDTARLGAGMAPLVTA